MDHASKYLVVETLKKESATLIRIGDSMYHDKDARFNCKELSERIMAALAEYEKEQAKIVHLKTITQGFIC